jgi:protein involved in polysaccharide export with SLBB domain
MLSLKVALAAACILLQDSLEPNKVDLNHQNIPLQRLPMEGQAPSPGYEWDPLYNINDYELGPGDVLNLHGFGGRGIFLSLVVTPDFKLVIPTVGVIDIRNRKFMELRSAVEQKINSRFKGMTVEIVLQKPRDFKVQILGEVNSTGAKGANAFTRLSDLIQKANNLRANASTIGIEIENVRTKHKTVVDYQKYLIHGDLEQNPFLKDGDIIRVPLEKNVTFVKGDVNHSTRFEFVEEAVSLKEVVEKECGGFVRRSPVGGQVVITRIEAGKSVTTFIEAEKFFNATAQPFNYETLQLRNGDQVFFPAASIKNPGIAAEVVFVTGEVRSPLPIPYVAGTPITSYIAAAGGISTRANYEEIEVYKASGATLSIRDRPSIEPGDTIHVPEKTFKFWQDHLTILMTFLTLVTTTIAISK